ncbi:ead/Ea22-like family protein [Salmonella enterica]|uniref:ead/Ea22-like family protein n=1 Tax=Salmonella enterica TaxID=28901 RepID=UPI001CC079FC|nr:ead/Ea22-like family protein [Salmonella enterica]UAM85042.1 ead/Ea22-like family protein [Salmonella enterica subsp. arizonae]WKN77754.1 ead/Ea22-like family protein [Salmonella enterica subsp. diarizonae]
MNIDKQALLRAAVKVGAHTWVAEGSQVWSMSNGTADSLVLEVFGDETSDQQDCDIASFIAEASPANVMALLDELCSANGYASAYEAEKWHYHGLAESEGERAARAEKQVEELTMWVKRLAHSLRNAKPNSKLHGAAMDYLSRKGLISVEDVLR